MDSPALFPLLLGLPDSSTSGLHRVSPSGAARANDATSRASARRGCRKEHTSPPLHLAPPSRRSPRRPSQAAARTSRADDLSTGRFTHARASSLLLCFLCRRLLTLLYSRKEKKRSTSKTGSKREKELRESRPLPPPGGWGSSPTRGGVDVGAVPGRHEDARVRRSQRGLQTLRIRRVGLRLCVEERAGVLVRPQVGPADQLGA